MHSKNSVETLFNDLVRRLTLPLVSLAVVALCQFATPQSACALQRKKQPSLTAEAVRESIQRGVNFLLRQSKLDRNTGSFGSAQSRDDITALCVLALLNSEVPPDHPTLKKSLDLIESVPRDKLSTYFVSLRIMSLATADPDGKRYLRQISGDVQWLVERQVTRGPNAGGWNYSAPRNSADASNSQFALLALHEAAKLGIDVPQNTWRQAAKYWKAVSTDNGGFRYRVNGGGASGSMTCAGISSWIIIEENLANPESAINGDRAVCCGSEKRSERIEGSDRLDGSKVPRPIKPRRR